MDQLKNKTVKSLYYLGMGKSASKLLSFINTLLLARLLSPQDYGLMAIVMVIIGFIGFFNEIGLGSALRQRIEVNEKQLNGVFTLTLLISFILYILMLLLSPAIATYYKEPVLVEVLQFIALTFIIGSIATVPDALIARNMNFKAYAGIEFLMVVIQCVVTLTLAWLDFNVWALAWGFVVSQLFRTIMIFLSSGWYPSRFGDFKAALDLVGFGASVTYSRLTWYFYNNANTLIIGKMMNSVMLGIYSMALTLATLPTSYITSMVIQIASPLFSKMQLDLSRLDNAMLRLTSGIAMIAFPMMVGMALTAKELVPVLLGEQWIEAVFPLQILCLVGVLKSIDPLITQAFISIGKANVTARYTSLCAVIIPLSVFIGALQGNLTAVAIALSVSYPLSSIYLFYSAKIHLNFSIRRYLKVLRMPIEACIWMSIWVYTTQWVLSSTLVEMKILILFAKFLVGAVSYLFFMIYIRKQGLSDCYEVLIELGIAKSKLNRWPFNKITERG
jgi:O-antigen/teichoic acid export membrane protein